MDDRLKLLAAQADEFFTVVQERYSPTMQCGRGCSACCKSGICVTVIEAMAIKRHMANMSTEQREAVVARAAREPDESCAALDDDGSCMIYDARPLICRAHGVPMRNADVLPVVACRLNFGGGAELAEVDQRFVFRRDHMAKKLTVVNRHFAAENGVVTCIAGIRNLIVHPDITCAFEVV